MVYAMITKKIPNTEDGSRLDRCIRRLLGNINQAILEKLLRSSKILLDEEKTKSSIKVKAGQYISYSKSISFNQEYKKNSFSMNTKKYYFGLYKEILIKQTNTYLAINKPNGLPVQGGSSQNFHIDDMLKCVFNNKNVPKLVHRLDKDTSGVLLVAKDQLSAKDFSENFREHKIIKTYLALVSPSPKTDSGFINLPLIKSGSDGDQRVRVDKDKGKSAITEYKVLDKVGPRVALLALSPKTGRTHQLRVHLESINSPIVGDNKYKGLNSTLSSVTDLSSHDSITQIKWKSNEKKNLQLHAFSLKLPSEELIEAELPEEFKQNLKFLGLTLPKNLNNIFSN